MNRRFARCSGSVLLALCAAASPALADREPLRVLVRGPLDAAAIRGRVEAELGVAVAAAAAEGSCDAPCLVVTLDRGNTATIIYMPIRGAPRARTVELGNDTANWPVVITLLAGNVVRDEAADLLAQLPERERAPEPQAAPLDSTLLDQATPATPSPPPEAPVIAPPPAAVAPAPHDSRLLGFGFVPGLSTDFTRVGRINHFLSLDLIAGVSGGSTGVTISGIADIERGPVSGFQIGGVTTVASRVSGMQLAGVAAASGDLHGVQVAGVAAVADSVDGAQVGGVSVLARRADLQIAGVAAVARGRASTQVAGVAASAGGAANVQVAGVASVARGTANIQIAGVVNVAQRIEGAQVGLINVARRVDGVQVGLINVGSADGFSFGLINIVPGGRADVEAAVDTSRMGTVLFRHGGRRWHNVYGVGGHPVDETGPSDDVWMYGLGFGPSWRAGSTVFDLELVGWQINHGARHSTDVSILSQLRLSVAYGIGPFKLVAGGVLNAYVSNDPQSPLVLERRDAGDTMEPGVHVTWWPSAFVGLRL